MNKTFESTEAYIGNSEIKNMLEETYKKLPGLHHHTYCFHTDEDIVRMVCDKLVNTYIS